MITPEQLAKSGTEHGHQAALFCWSNQNLHTYPQLKWLFAVPNGFFATPGQKAKMKAEGLKDGVPDIWLPILSTAWNCEFNRNKFYGLVIELKIPDKKTKNELSGTSSEQKEWIAHLLTQGYACYVAYGWEDARDMIIAYLEGK